MIGGSETYELDEMDDPYSWRSNASYFETFDAETEEWSDLKRNPFFNESTRWYWEGTSVTKDDSFLVFGGRLGFYKDICSKIIDCCVFIVNDFRTQSLTSIAMMENATIRLVL